MKSIVFFGFLFLNFFSFSQWSSIVTLNNPNNYSFTISHFCAVNENTVFTGGFKREIVSSPIIGILYYTLDGGAVRDSLEFPNRFVDALESPSPNIVYFITTQLVDPPVGSNYQRKFLHRSLDGGQTWNESIIDSSSLVLMTKPLSFLNDSVGIIRLGTSLYQITRDHGENWIQINLPVHKFSNTLGGDTILLEVQNIYTVNLTTLGLVDSFYSVNCIGSLKSYDKFGDTLIRAYIAQDGPEQGYLDNNYTSITIDEHPLGNQRVLHFPYVQIINSVHLTSTNIYLLSGSIASSSDGGYTFYAQESSEPDASVLVFMNLDFADENIGYAVTRSLADNTYKIQKTTNGGGITTNYITPPLQFVAGITETENSSISIYPNPATNKIYCDFALGYNTLKRIKITSITGQIILESDYYEDLVEISTSSFSKGIYVISVEFIEENKIFKSNRFIIQ